MSSGVSIIEMEKLLEKMLMITHLMKLAGRNVLINILLCEDCLYVIDESKKNTCHKILFNNLDLIGPHPLHKKINNF